MSNYNWVLKDNLITLIINGKEEYYPNSKELYLTKDEKLFNYNSIELPSPFEVLNIRFSKITMTPIYSLKYINEKIILSAYVQKNNEEIDIPIINNNFADYIIYNQTYYYLNASFQCLIQIINELKIHNINDLNYIEYMNLKRIFQERGINVSDEVQYIAKNTIPNNYRAIGLRAKLYEYQKKGFSWLKFMASMNCSCILADEMGLGKTLQVIALFGYIKEHKTDSHFIVIAPVSLIENWRREFLKFYPSLNILIHHGANRTGFYTDFLNYDVVITSYSNAQTDLSIINMVDWDIVALDEAQNIKNPFAKRTSTIKKIKRKMGIAITGTPFENHMTDIWSLMDFTIPDYFGKLSEFERKYTDTIDCAENLESFISPVMLRRRVSEVAKDLPERIDIPHPIIMTHDEAVYYDDGQKKLNEDPNLKDLSMEKIQKLRMFCTHPIVYNPDIICTDPKDISTKYELLCNIIEEIISLDEKIIIFTSFNKMIEVLVNDLKKRFNVYTNCINGATKINDRQTLIDEFSSIAGSAILVLNPKAAGVGLNITAANHVIHYNLEWNPAVEDQASARAYRRGQDKRVFIHRLFYVNTIEEVINERIQLKRDISDAAIIGNQGELNNSKDLLKALSLSPLNCF